MSDAEFIRKMTERHPYLVSRPASVVPVRGIGASLVPEVVTETPTMDYDYCHNQAMLGNPEPLYRLIGLL